MFQLRPDQIDRLSFAMAHPRGGDLSDPATGKTPVANMWMYGLWKEYGVKSVFMMPTSLFKQNYKSFFKFTPFEPDEIVLLRGTPKQKLKLMKNPRGKVFIASFNHFAPKPRRRAKVDPIFGTILKPEKPQGPSDYDLLRSHHKIEAVFVDEWHMGFKSITAARTQGLLYAIDSGQIVIFDPMTGTACDGHLDSVYPLIHAIEPRYYLNHQDFMNQHAVYDFFGTRVMGWQNVDKVQEILARHCIRRTFEEVHGKDETQIIMEEFDMAEDHAKFYKQFESDGLLETEGAFVEVESGGVMVTRLRQLCNCPEVLGDPRGEDLELTKDEAFEIHVTTALQCHLPFLAFAAHKPTQRRMVEIAEKSGARVALLNGDVPQGKQREKIEDDFREGKLDGVIASPDVVAVGYDWPHLRMVIHYSLDYKDSSFVQGNKRGVRGKREIPLIVYVMFYPGTVEEDILNIVQGKMELANQTDRTRVIFDLVKGRNPELRIGDRPQGKRLSISEMGTTK